jgi:ribosomal protein S18 acetylase RimI-like enzyme
MAESAGLGEDFAVITVRPLDHDDRPWALEVERESWGEPVVARRGEECELVTIDSLREGIGIGRALLDAVREAAVAGGCRRLWLVTTNDNLRALEIYQRWGMNLAAFRRDAVTEARKHLKPSISEVAANGIAIRHELELELLLDH